MATYLWGKQVCDHVWCSAQLATLRALGKWLDKNGWTTVMINAGVASSGFVESFIGASHVQSFTSSSAMLMTNTSRQQTKSRHYVFKDGKMSSPRNASTFTIDQM